MWILPTLGASYVATSILFTKYPNLLPAIVKDRKNWKVKKSLPKNVHISHRGGAGECYENTMMAFKKATDLAKTQMLEIDVHITKDGVVVVSHDQNLSRVTGKDVKIKETKFDELPKLKDEIPIEFTFGRSFSSDDKSLDHISVPKLEDVFEAFPDMCINIDIKTYDETLIDEVNKLVTKYGRENRTVWGNFSDKTTAKCYATNPQIGLLFSVKRVLMLLIYFYTGLLPYITLKETHLEIPMPLLAYKKYGPEITKTQKTIATLSNALLMRKTLFDHLSQRGIQTYVWVLNEEEDFEKAFKLNVTGVMTDYPSLLTDYLQKNPQFAQVK